MKWMFVPGCAAGVAAALFLCKPTAGVEIWPQWWCPVSSIESLQPLPETRAAGVRFFVRPNESSFWILKGDGRPLRHGAIDGGLAAFSGSGEYYVQYKKVGHEVEFCNAAGERFWKIESMEYPYLSQNARLVLLVNGDQTGIRIFDESGNAIGKPIAGRTCTAIAFADRGDRAAVGFLDGTYYFIGERGRIISRGRAPEGMAVKGMAVSDGGAFGAVHMGSTDKDYLRVVDIARGESEDVALNHVHYTRTALHAGDDGRCHALDVNRLIRVSSSGRVEGSIPLPPARPGHAAIRRSNGLVALSYSDTKGTGRVFLFREGGVPLFSREYQTESFIDARLQSDLLFLRGSDNLYCYRVRR